jgi:ATP-dependent Clp protease ATP-binding subunit ClpX
MKKNGDSEVLRCSFCNKDQNDVRKLIAGPTVFICDECVDVCNDIIADDRRVEGRTTNRACRSPTRSSSRRVRDRPEQARKAGRRGLQPLQADRDRQAAGQERRELTKSNILLIGPTGTGKTRLLQTLAKLLSVPFTIVDATTLTEAGYVGEDVENIILKLPQAAGGDIEVPGGSSTSSEIDRSRADEPLDHPRRLRRGQQALLKILQGTVANVPPGGRKHPHQEFYQIDTTTSFICGGAFVASTAHRAPHRGRAWVPHRLKAATPRRGRFGRQVSRPTSSAGLIPVRGCLPVIGRCTTDNPAGRDPHPEDASSGSTSGCSTTRT